jgi:Universal stress protein family
MAGCVVCGIDDSSGARKAARVANGLARSLGAPLVLVHAAPVAPSVLYGVPFDNDAFQREVLDDARRLLEDVARSYKAAAHASQRAELRSPTEVLARVLEDEHADLPSWAPVVAARCDRCYSAASPTRCSRPRRARSLSSRRIPSPRSERHAGFR